MTDIEKVRSKIEAIEFALASFYDFENDEAGRKIYLAEHFTSMPALKSYVHYSVEDLKVAIKQLQEEKNLLLTRAQSATSIATATAAPSVNPFQNTPFPDQDGEWVFRPRTAPLPQASYSPIQYSPITPISRSESNVYSEDFLYYYQMLKKAVKRYNRIFRRKQWSVQYKGGHLVVLEGLTVMINLKVSTAIEMSNIYHLFKGCDSSTDSGCIRTFIAYLESMGIPTIVQAVHSGHSPAVDDEDYSFEGVERY
jgi:hypothetical protein